MEDLIAQYRLLHQRGRYGLSSELRGNPERIQGEIDIAEAQTVLDYGCGQSSVYEQVQCMAYDRYDPAVEGCELIPQAEYDLVICTDVLEHIPEEELEETVERIRGLAPRAFFGVALTPAGRLPGGQPLHVTLKPTSWWQGLLENHYRIVAPVPYGGRGEAVIGFRCRA